MNKKDSLWDIAVEKNSTAENDYGKEKSLIFVGTKGSGKSTIIQNFIDQNDVIKETLALEYNFGRKSGRSLMKETCHIWELGGGTLYLNLLNLQIGKKNTSLVLVLDLSAPESLWTIMETILTYVYNYYKRREENDDARTQKQSEDRVKFPMPLVIVGGKYDLFQMFDAEKKKRICHTLRSVAHALSASLIFYSDKDGSLVKKLKDVLHSHGFGGSQWKGHCTDYNKPLLIAAGNDSLEEIGINEGSLPSRNRGLSLDSFKHSYTMFFPQVTESLNMPDDPAKDQNFKEPLIDSLRAQKDDELDRFLMEIGQRRKYTQSLVF